MEVFFILSSVVAVAGAVLVVSQRVAIYSLLGLLISFAGTAGVYYTLDAGFVAVSQILVYAGAIAVLFLFVLMFANDAPPEAGPLTTVGARKDFDPGAVTQPEGRAKPRLAMPSPLAALVSLCTLALLYLAIYKLPPGFGKFLNVASQTEVAKTSGGTELVEFGSARGISYAIFDRFPLAFEVVSLLIFAAILGAVLLTRRFAAQSRAEAEALARSQGLSEPEGEVLEKPEAHHA